MSGAAYLTGSSGMFLYYTALNTGVFAGLVKGGASRARKWACPLYSLGATPLAIGASSLLEMFLPGGHSLFASATTMTVSWGTAYWVGKRYAVPRVRSPLRRGTMLGSQENLAGRPATGRALGSSILLAGMPVPARDETKHFKMLGTTGTGKSTAIREVLGSAFARGDRAVIADADGGYGAHFFRSDRGDVILNPFDPRSVRWDIYSEIEGPADVAHLVRSLIPDSPHHNEWRGYARTFLSAMLRQTWTVGSRSPRELYRLLVTASTEELRGLLHGTPAQPFLETNNGRMFDSIRSVASSALEALEHISEAPDGAFSVRRWTREGGTGSLFIPYKAREIPALRTLISAWMRLAIFERMSLAVEPGGAPRDRLWYVVDELDALGPIDGLKDALARLRKFEGRCVLGFQSIAQVSSTYGDGDAHTIVENCGNTLLFRCSASEGGGTAQFASRLIGEREVVRVLETTSHQRGHLFPSHSYSEQIAIEPAVLASQVEQLPDLAGYLKYASDPVWRRIDLGPSLVEMNAAEARDKAAVAAAARGKVAAAQAGAATGGQPRLREPIARPSDDVRGWHDVSLE